MNLKSKNLLIFKAGGSIDMFSYISSNVGKSIIIAAIAN
jgi:hypothetical protein